MVTASPGSRVRIYTSRGQIDPNTYQVTDLDKQTATLLCESTQQTIKVHKSRIKELVNTITKENTVNTKTSNDMDTESTATIPTTEMEESTTDSLTQEMATTTTKATADTKVDFDQMVRDGYEVWTKGDCEFDQPGVKVQAHCIISPDRSEFETFNTYNGSRGKNNGKPKNGQARRKSVYPIGDTTALEKKRKTLEKKGYTRHEI